MRKNPCAAARRPWGWLALLWVLGMVTWSGSSQAHFSPFAIRMLHVSENNHDLEVLMRLPLPLVLLHENWQGIDSGEALDFVRVEAVDNQWRYRLDGPALENNWPGFAGQMLQPYDFRTGQGTRLEYQVEEINVHAGHDSSGFSTLASARKAFDGFNELSLPAADEIFSASVDVKLTIQDASLADGLLMASKAGQGLAMLDQLFNSVSFYSAQGQDTRNSLGLLNESLTARSGVVEQLLTMLISGLEHIFAGWDHLVFMFLLVVASVRFRTVFFRASAFTLGHCITLVLGVFGFAPQGEWFIPVVELAIAASIIYGAVMILRARQEALSGQKVFCIGLVHGYGFSFVMQDVLAASEANVVVNLLGFNLGIEVGQCMVYLLALPVVSMVKRINSRGVFSWQSCCALPCMAVALYWFVERGLVAAQGLLA